MTDKNGRFTFPLPEPGEYRIVADAGAGHRAKKTLTVTAAEPRFRSFPSIDPSMVVDVFRRPADSVREQPSG